ncbi:MAG TPA: DoxX family protein [Casimicrobiaceae bacterium]|nr:DoxX family protein [Casimicrobiaceae bacterium]
MTTTQKDWAALVGRVLLALMFIISGWGKITDFSGTAGYIASQELPMPQVLAVIAILIELGAGLAIAFGWKTRWAALVMVAFLIVITPIFHGFWNEPADQAMMQQINFMKNLSILGGMLVLFAWGPGRFSFDEGRLGAAELEMPRRRATDVS